MIYKFTIYFNKNKFLEKKISFIQLLLILSIHPIELITGTNVMIVFINTLPNFSAHRVLG